MYLDALAAVAVTTLGWYFFLRKKYHVDKYQYLSVLSHYKWKSFENILEDMRKVKGMKISAHDAYSALGDLVHENLVVDRVNLRRLSQRDGIIMEVEIHEFRLTNDGVRHQTSPQDDPDEVPEDAVTT